MGSVTASLGWAPVHRKLYLLVLVSPLLVIRMFVALGGILTNGGIKENSYFVTLVKEW